MLSLEQVAILLGGEENVRRILESEQWKEVRDSWKLVINPAIQSMCWENGGVWDAAQDRHAEACGEFQGVVAETIGDGRYHPEIDWEDLEKTFS